MYKRQIVNSVNFEDGHKLQWSKADLQNLKDRCNEQSRQQGLHIPEKGKTFSGEEREETVAWNKETYKVNILPVQHISAIAAMQYIFLKFIIIRFMIMLQLKRD